METRDQVIDELTSLFLEKRHSDGNDDSLSNESWNDLLARVPELSTPSVNRFFAIRSEGDPLRRRDRLPDQHGPYLMADIMRVAKSFEEMLAAESIARDFVAALAPWGATNFRRVTWYFLEESFHSFHNVSYLGQPFDFARDTLWESLENAQVGKAEFAIDRDGVPNLVRDTVQANEGWRYAVDNVLSITGPKYAIPSSDWRPFAELRNPFELLISFWRTGCFIYDVPTEDDPALRLYIQR